MGAWLRFDHPQIGGALRIGVLVHEPGAVGRPHGRDVRAPPARDRGNRRIRGIPVQRRHVEMPRTVVVRGVRVECDPGAVGRPDRPPRFKFSFGDLNRIAAA